MSVFAAAIGGALCLGIGAANAATALIDFTKPCSSYLTTTTSGGSGCDTNVTAISGTAGGVDWVLSAMPAGQKLSFQRYDGAADPLVTTIAGGAEALDITTDGVGVLPDDEVTEQKEWLKLEFFSGGAATQVRLEGFAVLDLYMQNRAIFDSLKESVRLVAGDGATVLTEVFATDPVAAPNTGFAEVSGLTNATGSTFFFYNGDGKDDATADFSLAAVSFSPAVVPLPAAGLLLVGGLAGLAMLRRRV